MIYTATCDGNFIYNLKRGYTLIDPVLDLADNSAGSFEFTMAPDHPMYDKVNTLTSEVIVYRDGVEIWSGRPIEENIDFYKRKNVYCEGELAYLNDSIQSPAEYHDKSVRQWLTTLINNHNAQVAANKQFAIGSVTVEDNLYRYTNYESTMYCIEDKLINRLGGHLRIRKVNGKRYLDYLKDYPKRSTQVIKFGRNLLDYSTNFTMADIATAIIPLGARLDNSPIDALEAYLDVKKVNNNSVYVRNETAIRNFGWICQVVHWDDVTTAAALLTKARQYLSAIQYDKMTLEIRPVDFNLVDSNEPALELLDEVRVVSKPHGLDKWFPITEQKIPLGDPENEVCTMGVVTQHSFTTKTASSVQAIKEAIEKITPESTILKQAQENATQLITSGALGSHVVVKPDEIYIMDTADESTARRVWRWNVNGLGYSSTGINGNFGLAMTMDGRIVADYITTGTLSANRIKGGTLTLGGNGNGNGMIDVRDSSNGSIATIDNNGVNIRRGSIQLGSNFSVDSNGNLTAKNAFLQGSILNIASEKYTWLSNGELQFGKYTNNKYTTYGTLTVGGEAAKLLSMSQLALVGDSRSGNYAPVSIAVNVGNETREMIGVHADRITFRNGWGNGQTVYIPAGIGAGGVVTSYWTAKVYSGLLIQA